MLSPTTSALSVAVAGFLRSRQVADAVVVQELHWGCGKDDNTRLEGKWTDRTDVCHRLRRGLVVPLGFSPIHVQYLCSADCIQHRFSTRRILLEITVKVYRCDLRFRQLSFRTFASLFSADTIHIVCLNTHERSARKTTAQVWDETASNHISTI